MNENMKIKYFDDVHASCGSGSFAEAMEQHAKKMQKLLGVLHRKCRFNKTAGKHSFKY